MCTLFYHSSATQSVQELSTHSINRFCCLQPFSPVCSLYPVQSLLLYDLSAGSREQLNGHSEAQQVFRLSAAQDNVHLVHEAKNVATQASLIHLAKPKEAVRWICKIHQPAERVPTQVQQTSCLQEAEMSVWKSFNPLSQWLLPIRWGLIRNIAWFIVRVHNRKEKVEVLISFNTIRSNLFCLALVVNFTGLGAFFWWLFFLCYSQAGCLFVLGLCRRCSYFLPRKPGQPPPDNSLDSSWLIESDSEHMHTHRHTPTHTVGGYRQLRGGNTFTTACIKMLAEGGIGS